MSALPPDVLNTELVRKLKAAARAGQGVDAAQVHFLNLGDLIERSGVHGAQVINRVRSGSAEFIRGCVEENDLVIPCDDGFLIVFAEGGGESLARRTQEMQELLTAFYFGEEGLEALRVRVEPHDVTQSTISNLIRAPQPAQPPPPSSSHDIVFWPVWAAQADLIACYFCAPTYCEQGVVRAGYDGQFRSSARHDGPGFAELDMAILKSASSHLHRLQAVGSVSIIGASVHVSTLRRRKSFAEYLKLLHAQAESVRRRMVVKIAEIEPGTPPASLTEWIALLKQQVRHVALEFHHSERAIERLRLVGAWSVGFELPAHARDPAHEVISPLNGLTATWLRSARMTGARLHVGNFRSASLLVSAKTAGIDFATSEVIWPALRAPLDVIKATVDKIQPAEPPRPRPSDRR